MSRIDEIRERLNKALKVHPYEEQDRDEHKSKAWSDFYQHAPDDLAWLLDALARRDQRCEDLTASLDETRAAIAAIRAIYDNHVLDVEPGSPAEAVFNILNDTKEN